MNILSGDISAMVFRRAVGNDLGEFSLDGQMLRVLMELDGSRDVRSVARAVGMNIATVKDALSRLLTLNLVVQAEEAVPMLNTEFMNYLKEQLSFATGPIAELLIEDAVEDMGLKLEKIPRHRAAELTDLLARQIPREEKKTQFQQAMLERIKERGS